MTAYKAPVSDAMFLLEDVFAWEAHRHLPGFGEADLETVSAILGEAARVCEETLAPLNASGDREGCRFEGGAVQTPQGFREAYADYAAGGWVGLSAPAEYGGQGLPFTLGSIVNEFTASANLGFVNYPGLTQSAITCLAASASPDLRRIYLPPLIAGRWTGVMCLTEPHCGTDLGLVRTRATPLDDGAYAITGQKIFVTGGEHDLTENIVHMVLARIDGAPAGTRGLSLFVTPKFLPDANGAPGERNAFACGSIERKMGLHASATCTMNYDGARGFLVGEPHRGLPAMFVMMNEARLGVGAQGLAISEIAYQNAVLYARERLQGRALGGPAAPDKPADPIIVHQDVRRMLLDMRAFNEAARALMICVSLAVDVANRSGDEDARRRAGDFVGLLTPVLKGVLTDRGFDSAVAAQQVFGGHGYIVENGVEQFVRDARIPMIYEGSNGVQAMDLVLRKLPREGGRAISAFMADVGAFVRQREDDAALRAWIAPLASGLGDLRKANLWLMDNAMTRPQNAAAGACEYMHLLGLVALGWMQARIAEAALGRRVADPATGPAMDAKLVAARWFMERIMPETALRLARIESGACTMTDMPDEAF